MSAPARTNRLHCISPLDGSIVVQRELASAGEIAAVGARAQRGWRNVPLTDRREIVSHGVECFCAGRAERAIDGLVDGAFFNAGQSCCAIERFYVHRSLYEDFVGGAVALVERYRLGNPLDPETTLGPMVRASAADFVREQTREALAQSARALVDAARFEADRGDGPYLAPQILVGVDHTMRAMREETFGPLVGIMPVDSDEAAVDLMNDSPYGLTASIWTRDLERAAELGSRIETGTVFANRCDYIDPALVWTGVKDSGRGCSLSRLGFGALTRPKSFHLKSTAAS